MQEHNFKATKTRNRKAMLALKVGEFFLEDEDDRLCQVVNSEQVDLSAFLPADSNIVPSENIVFYCDLESGELCCDSKGHKLVNVPVVVNLSYSIVET